ncbi:hypothetical protein [Tissierella sp.]|uniref:hypothetical protein n=1 Tax=Tissierella sp. TaxID=41274 RepID=UPI0028A864FF|nr:hypothetical protein [Tissierella sp.]
MNEYVKIAMATRNKVSRVTLEQQKQILKLYNDVIKELSHKAAESGDKSLTQRWTLDYINQLKAVKKDLRREINKQIRESIKQGAKIGTETEQLIFKEIFRMANIDPGEHFTEMFSQVQDKVVKDIISGNLYKDNKTLSIRIWSYGEDFEKDIQYTVNQAIIEKKSASELANDLEKFVREPAKRGTDWGLCYPSLKNKKVDYNAMRLARTSINHAYQNSSIQSSNMNPFVEGIKWHSAMVHGRTCELCIERATEDKYGLGPGIFPKNDVPLDHANGLCTMIPYISRSLIEVADELRDWIDGSNNSRLDEWYNEYGDYFAYKKI